MPHASAGALQVDEDQHREPAPRGRRTVTITGRPEKRFAPPPRPVGPVPVPHRLSPRSPRFVAIERRRPRPRASERLGPRPDKLAMWAVLMALFLILVTVASSHAAG
jgi:hypothetical protein